MHKTGQEILSTPLKLEFWKCNFDLQFTPPRVDLSPSCCRVFRLWNRLFLFSKHPKPDLEVGMRNRFHFKVTQNSGSGRFSWFLFRKHSFGSHRLVCVASLYQRFCNLDFSFHATETLSVIHNGGKVNGDGLGWVETGAAAIRQQACKLWWFNSHANYLIHRKEERKKKEEKNRFSKKQHTTQALARKQHTRWSKQKPHTHNYNLLHLTQLHVSWIIRQRLDNPDRSPIHSLSSPLQILILQYRFRSIKGLQRISGSQGLLSGLQAKAISRFQETSLYTFHILWRRSTSTPPFPPPKRWRQRINMYVSGEHG